MREEIEQHPREPEKDVEQRRMTDRGTDPGTSEPGTPPREPGSEPGSEPEKTADESDRSPRIGPPGTTQVGEHLEGAPTEDSPAREPTERIERMLEEQEGDEGTK